MKTNPPAASLTHRYLLLLPPDPLPCLQCAKHQHLAPAVCRILQAALPHLEAFKTGYQLAMNAPFLAQTSTGSHTLELLTRLKVGGCWGNLVHARQNRRELPPLAAAGTAAPCSPD